MKLAVLSNINLDPLKLHLNQQMGAMDPYFCAYGQHLLELLDKQSGLYQGDLDALFVHLDAEELLKDDFFRLVTKPEENNTDLTDFLAALRGFC
jgi:predicted enzyme involved in methoxymalonyl-ACP biosynthesis